MFVIFADVMKGVDLNRAGLCSRKQKSTFTGIFPNELVVGMAILPTQTPNKKKHAISRT